MVNEQKEVKRVEANATTANSNDGIPATKSLLEEAKGIAEEMKRSNAERASLIEREEALEARRVISGRAEAAPVIMPKVETAKEYAEKVLSGKFKPQK